MRELDWDPPELKPNNDLQLVTQERRYRLITPLFGGGVETGAADPITTVRATEVRGQLRFWWRATRGGQFTTIAHMRNTEELLWGAASTKEKPRPAQVQIALTVTSEGKTLVVKDNQGHALMQRKDDRDEPMNPGHPYSPYGYGAFPLNSREGAELREGVRFNLTIMFCEGYRADVEAALWAWETFGGLGGRTRRGFGALACEDYTEKRALTPDHTQAVSRPEPTREAINVWLAEQLKHHVIERSAPQNVPHLSRTLACKPTHQPNTADDTLRYLLDRLKAFRQQRKKVAKLKKRGSNEKIQIPDRNRWPEPDTIREAIGSKANYRDQAGNVHDHTHPINQVNGQPVRKYPRAAFGLPIIFQFKDPGDPPGQYTLTAKGPEEEHGYDRFASPLIVRPLECNGGKCLGLAALLEGTRLPDGLMLVANSRKIEDAEAELTPQETQQIRAVNGQQLLLPNAAGTTAHDVLRAFLNFL